MGTRSVIARVKGDGFEGVYQHWDGYPTHTGKRLYEMAQTYTKVLGKTLGEMMRDVIDAHPAGWSTAFAEREVEFGTMPNGRTGYRETGRTTPPKCYCHDERGERLHGGGSEANLITSEGDDCGTEWAYAVNEKTGHMYVFERTYENGTGAVSMFGMSTGGSKWALRADVDLEGPEPNWKAMQGEE